MVGRKPFPGAWTGLRLLGRPNQKARCRRRGTGPPGGGSRWAGWRGPTSREPFLGRRSDAAGGRSGSPGGGGAWRPGCPRQARAWAGAGADRGVVEAVRPGAPEPQRRPLRHRRRSDEGRRGGGGRGGGARIPQGAGAAALRNQQHLHAAAEPGGEDDAEDGCARRGGGHHDAGAGRQHLVEGKPGGPAGAAVRGGGAEVGVRGGRHRGGRGGGGVRQVLPEHRHRGHRGGLGLQHAERGVPGTHGERTGHAAGETPGPGEEPLLEQCRRAAARRWPVRGRPGVRPPRSRSRLQGTDATAGMPRAPKL